MEYIGFPPRRFGALKSLALGIMVGMLRTLQEQLSCRCATLLVSTWNHQAYTLCHVSVGANSEQFDSTFRLQSVTPTAFGYSRGFEFVQEESLPAGALLSN
jgi:hypothetical protein